MASSVSASSVAGMFLSTCLTLGVIGSPFFAFVALKSIDLREILALDLGESLDVPKTEVQNGNPSSSPSPSPSEAEEQAANPDAASSQLNGPEKQSAPLNGERTDSGADFLAHFARKLREKSEHNLTPWYADPESRPFLMLTRGAVLSAAALFGALGATLSVLTRISSVPIGVSQLVGLQLVGATFALILALIFAGGFIQGSLFPEGLYTSWFGVIYVHEEFAKLLVWSFIAGFSERTIPEILRKFTERLSGEVDDDQSREKDGN